MISSNTQKSLLIVFLALLLCSSCRFWQSDNSKIVEQDSESEIQTNVPFPTKEPDTFQAEIIVTYFLNSEKIERKYFVAKKGEKLFTTYGVGNKDELSYLLRSEDEPFLINHDEKTIRKRHPMVISIKDTLRNEWRHFLVPKLLNERQNVMFEKVGVENNLTKYRVLLENAEYTEVFVFIDDKIPFPIKQEFYILKDDKKVLNYSVEIKNYKTEVEDKLFELPKDYKEIN